MKYQIVRLTVDSGPREMIRVGRMNIDGAVEMVQDTYRALHMLSRLIEDSKASKGWAVMLFIDNKLSESASRTENGELTRDRLDEAMENVEWVIEGGST